MSSVSIKSFNLPWHQFDQYRITLFGLGSGLSPQVKQQLQVLGMQASGEHMTIQTDRQWKNSWNSIYTTLQKLDALTQVEVAIMPGNVPANAQEGMDRKLPNAIQAIAENLWLGDALLEDRLLCYLQPVVSARDKTFGYESFARVRMPDGTIVAGDKIVAASRALNIEYMIDRHLHVQAIRTFVSSDFNGFLFINLFPGFIHRPAVYLEGLSETAKGFGLIAKHLVLDFTRSESTQDLTHLKSVCEYARSRGYSIALDDIESVEGARKLVPEIHPDFLKIDMQLARRVEETHSRESIREIVEFVHKAGGTVIAEGVETEEMHVKLKQLEVDLFQGYYFSPPVPVEAALKRSTGT